MATVDDGEAMKMPLRIRSLPTYGTLTMSRFREQDSQTGTLRLNKIASTNIPLATRVMAGPAVKLKW